MFLRVDDFESTCQRMTAAGVRFVSPPRDEPYGRVAVFLDPRATGGICSDQTRGDRLRMMSSWPDVDRV